MTKPFIHPSTPPKLRAAFHRAKNLRGEGYKLDALAREIKVNIYYLYQMIKKGIEPNDTTEKLREVRVRMFLPRKKRKPRQTTSRVPRPESIRWWWSLPTETRQLIIQQLFEKRSVK